MARFENVLTQLKKHKITIISILAFAVAFGCIFAFAGNKDESTSLPDEESVVSDATSGVAPEASTPEEEKLLDGIGVYVDGKLIAAVNDEATAQNAIDKYVSFKSLSLGIDSNAVCELTNTIEFTSGKYSSEAFADENEIAAMLGMKNKHEFVSSVHNYMNEVVSVKLSIRSTQSVSQIVVIEHSVKTVYTDAMRDGVVEVVTKGFDGEGKETYEVICVDGVEISRTMLSHEVVVEPTPKVVRVGTCSDGMDVATHGDFIKPYDGIITSYMGPRWGRTHKGIDIADSRCNGAPAVAAAGGVVVRAEFSGGYGNCVVIDHGNGIKTLYAHFQSLSVSVGDVVNAGDEVGKIGSTGNSTGPHLHFEVHVDGEIVNPLIFVDYE